jgi:D-arabinose 1-dehydrogenase-like Zn-dependent alcohol dehydrogenase
LLAKQWGTALTHVGHTQYSNLSNLTTPLDDVAEGKIKLAIECGADKAINSITNKEAVETAPATIVISGANAAYAGAIGLTSNHGVVVGVGIPPEDLKINCLYPGFRFSSFMANTYKPHSYAMEFSGRIFCS